MEILQFTLLASDFVFRGRTPFLAINSNRFGKPSEFEMGALGFNEKGEVLGTEKENNPSRKIFRTYLPELLKEKLLTRIKTKDNRSKYYSITPLGIIYLIKSEMFFDGIKYPHPERNYVILVLQTFAQPNVKPYNSVIFEKQKFINYETDFLGDIAKYLGISFRHQVPNVFSNVNIVQENMQSKYFINLFEFFITNGYSDSNKYRLAIFDFKDEKYVKVEELDKTLLNSFTRDEKDYVYQGLSLDDEQFHHYLANLMLCSFIYDSAIANFDGDNLFNIRLPELKKKSPHLTKREQFRDENKDIPEYFLRILLLFSKHILRLSQKQFEVTTNFNKELGVMQFIQTKVSKS